MYRQVHDPMLDGCIDAAALPARQSGARDRRQRRDRKGQDGLLKDPKVSGLAVSVETFKGMVLLSGFMKTKAESDLAHKIAHDTPGVSGVVNSLQIR